MLTLNVYVKHLHRFRFLIKKIFVFVRRGRGSLQDIFAGILKSAVRDEGWGEK